MYTHGAPLTFFLRFQTGAGAFKMVFYTRCKQELLLLFKKKKKKKKKTPEKKKNPEKNRYKCCLLLTHKIHKKGL